MNSVGDMLMRQIIILMLKLLVMSDEGTWK